MRRTLILTLAVLSCALAVCWVSRGTLNATVDEARLLHDCLCDWEKLDDEKRSYDYNTVDVSVIEYGFNDELSTH